MSTPGAVVRYFRNGILLSYQNNAAITGTLIVDASLQSNSATLTNVRTSFSTLGKTIVSRLNYDHMGRPLRSYHQLDAQPEVLLTQNEYNELGQLVDKKVHSVGGSQAKQSVDYRYNIRGWLTKINESDIDAGLNDATNAGEARDFFGMELGYNAEIGVGNSQLFNGNISGISWSNNQGLNNTKQNAHTYTYDPMNRILGSAFKEKAATWSAALANSAFAESGFTYDLNGNIKTLTRNDKRNTGTMDILGYTYTGNLLLKVADTGDKFTGFVDGTNTTNDYTYDANGNMITDQNKGITGAITYNYLNLPELITRGGNTVRYIYTSSGAKISRVASQT